ncbi:LegC family aminotransferase [Bdellovibrio sp. HCB337]|uniref:LegC family aminotransferase n=1 Tax=Bdellovibrio sp. HCB337 TaxID=3394358 RepID=UPI0039A617A8
MLEKFLNFTRDLYDPTASGKFIPLHEPRISQREKDLVQDCIDSTFISSVGEYVGKFEKMISEYTNIPFAIATTNGTSALHLSLVALGVGQGDLVLAQALSFIATANPIAYCGASPVFIDSAKDNLGMCPEKLEDFLKKETMINAQGVCVHKASGRAIKVCIPMHVFGHPVKMDEIAAICEKHHIAVLEDAAEALGSFYKGQHVGRAGKLSIFSFNGNKIVTCGGGGMIVTSDPELAKRIKHLSTTAKVPHAWEFVHDEVGYNYRLPNLNAAFACAQMEKITEFVEDKRKTAESYRQFFASVGTRFIVEPANCRSNYWLNAIQLESLQERDEFLKASNAKGVMARPIWKLLPTLPMYKGSISTSLENASFYEARIVNIPSSVRSC